MTDKWDPYRSSPLPLDRSPFIAPSSKPDVDDLDRVIRERDRIRDRDRMTRELEERRRVPLPEGKVFCPSCVYSTGTNERHTARCAAPSNGFDFITGKMLRVSCEEKNATGDCPDWRRKS